MWLVSVGVWREGVGREEVGGWSGCSSGRRNARDQCDWSADVCAEERERRLLLKVVERRSTPRRSRRGGESGRASCREKG